MKQKARPKKEKNKRAKGREKERLNGEAEYTTPPLPPSSSLHNQVCSLPFSHPCSENNVCQSIKKQKENARKLILKIVILQLHNSFVFAILKISMNSVKVI